jgi:hypothetical protein
MSSSVIERSALARSEAVQILKIIVTNITEACRGCRHFFRKN